MKIQPVSVNNKILKTSPVSKMKYANLPQPKTENLNLNHSKDTFNSTRKRTNFTGLSCSQIENKLLKENGIISDFRNNQLVADCIMATVNIFENILGQQYLPSRVKYTSFKKDYPEHTNSLGLFVPLNKNIAINSDCSCFDSFYNLKLNNLLDYHILLDNEKSTIHPLHTFVHEFVHCAHYTNLCNNNTDCNWNWLSKQNIKNYSFLSDSCIYGKYSQTDFNEYFAEVMTKEILKDVSSDYPTQYNYTNNIYLETIKPDYLPLSHKLNTYYIWQGDKEKIENNLSNMRKLNEKLSLCTFILRSLA